VLEVKLVGADTCNRYKRMREIVLDEVARANIEIALVEENEAMGILKYRTVNLPMLFIGGKKIAQGNPPSRKKVQACLRAR
jgi:Thioredoxin domain